MKTKLEAIRERNENEGQGLALSIEAQDRAFLLKLQSYVQHRIGCDLFSVRHNTTLECTCGLTALLETPE